MRGPRPVVLELDGKRVGRRTSFLVDGQRADLPDGEFIVVLKLAALRARKSMDYLSSSDLGIYRTPHVPSRLRASLEPVMPRGVAILQRGEPGMFRLHPIVEVEGIDWAVLERNPHAGIQAIAAAERKRR